MKLCADYIRLLERFGVAIHQFDAIANPVVRHVNRVFGENVWEPLREPFTLELDERYRRGLANAAREIRRARGQSCAADVVS